MNCVQCDKPVEEARECYAHPTCYACLPPPEPLPVAWTPVLARMKIEELAAELAALRAQLAAVTAERDEAQAEVARLRKLFDDVGGDEHNLLALLDLYQERASVAVAERDEAEAWIRDADWECGGCADVPSCVECYARHGKPHYANCTRGRILARMEARSK